MIDNSTRLNLYRDFTKRIYILLAIFLFILFILALKIGYIQIVKKKYYQRFAQGQVEQRISVRATRGLIYDRNGELIVDNRLGYSVFITPAYLPKDKVKREKLISYLASTLNITVEALKDKIAIKDIYLQNKYTPILIKRDIDRDSAFTLKENENYFEGVEVSVIPIRRYLMGDRLAHLLGYTGIIDPIKWSYYQKVYNDSDDNPYESKNTVIGKTGLENRMDLQLRGEDGIAIRLVDSRGKPILDSSNIIKKPSSGKRVYLTIDKDLQDVAKRALNGKRGVVIVSKPSNGEVLALVSNPSFDPKIFIKRQAKLIKEIIHERPDDPLFNKPAKGKYPPSSIFKLVVALAALDGKGISPSKKFTCTGGVTAGNRYFKCHGVHGRLDMVGAIKESCNSYFYQLGDEIGWSIIYKYANMFQLTQPYELFNGLKVTGFIPSIKSKKKKWYKGDTFNHSIGQGYTLLPPLKIHNIISAIANDGVLYKPRLIKEIVSSRKGDTIKPKSIILQKKFISDFSLNVLKKSIRSVVINGTASYYGRFSKTYLIAGKTGTAQNVSIEPHAWFSAYAPYNSDSPSDRIVVTVLVENTPKGGGGTVAAPIATAIIKYYFEQTSLAKTQQEMGRNDLFDINGKDEQEGLLNVSLGNSHIKNTNKTGSSLIIRRQNTINTISNRPIRGLRNIKRQKLLNTTKKTIKDKSKLPNEKMIKDKSKLSNEKTIKDKSKLSNEKTIKDKSKLSNEKTIKDKSKLSNEKTIKDKNKPPSHNKPIS